MVGLRYAGVAARAGKLYVAGGVTPSGPSNAVYSFDPSTRHAFRVWQQAASAAITGRGQDLNDSIGNLPHFAADAP